MKLSDGERLIILMLADLSKSLKIKGEMDPEFIEKMVINNDLWAINWKYHGIQFEKGEDPPEVRETCDILDMWSFVEAGYKKLSAADKKKVKTEAAPYGDDVKFHGFDGNHEPHTFIAGVLIKDLERWSEFKGRALNAHTRTVERYPRMCRAFEGIRPSLDMRHPSADEITKILLAQKHG
ncbi:YfbU family protein [Bradyrhizobium sp. CCBAU 45384]|uniref:YfbU family protein n=1 Tax=Bradyrhizobium sp. CCBAU 45384 TaxID=858428 RepID=UPI002304D2F4|nr:YfbU family protein [Bradyrhizobium sp. CCBAU 45384]MDA9410589.1 hypothetical protein [Bradyrhizobium sp. CCBAU 45384]